jgi:hypothetical protein
MASKEIKTQGAAAVTLEANWTPVFFAQSPEEVEHYRGLLEAEGIATLLGAARKGGRGPSGIPLQVPAEMLAVATELIACKDAISADWDEDDSDDDDDFLDDDDEEDDDDDDEDEEDDDFLPDDDDDTEDEDLDSDLDD